MRLYLYVALAWATFVQSRFNCPNDCSGHGYCTDYTNDCYCETGYQGIDCSLRKCPLDLAWASKAYAVNTAHELAECSNAGKCNFRTGKCACGAGFGGEACQKTTCGSSNCNGHGACLTLGEVYGKVSAYNFKNLTEETLSIVPIVPRWESNHATMCACARGWSGPACEYRLCPKGDDPVTPHTAFRTITITISSDRDFTKNQMDGQFLFQFNGQSFTFSTDASVFTAAACKAAMEGLRNIQTVSCQLLTPTVHERTYTIELQKFPTFPFEDSIFTNDGNPPLSAFSCSTDQIGLRSRLDVVFCTVGEQDTDKIYPEYALCSNRGICDFLSGNCLCFQQFTNSSCDVYKSAVAPFSQRAIDSDVFKIGVSNDDFADNVLTINTFDIGTEAFTTIRVEDRDKVLFTMDGYGNLVMNYGGLIIGDVKETIQSGHTIATGGLTVIGGVTTDELAITGDIDVLDGGLTIQTTGITVTTQVEISGDTQILGGMDINAGLNVTNGGIDVVAGGGSVITGGLFVVGGITVAAGGVVLGKRGVTIYNGGFVVSGGVELRKVHSSLVGNAGMEVKTGGMVMSGVTVFNVGMDMGDGITIGSGGLRVDTGVALSSGGVHVTEGVTVLAGGIIITGGLSILNAGMVVPNAVGVTDGITVYNSGLYLTDGLTIQGAGVLITGGVTVTSGSVLLTLDQAATISLGAYITGGLSVQSLGLKITAGLTVPTAGLEIVSGGLFVAGGLVLTGGLSVLNGGLQLTGGITILNTGLYLPDALIVNLGGLSVTAGLTLFDLGLHITDGLTVSNSGLKVVEGMTVLEGGVVSSHALNVLANGLYVTAGVTVYSGAVRVTDGLSVMSAGLVLTSGLSIGDLGLIVTGGFTVRDTGMYITSGLTLYNTGLKITGGLSANNLGVYVTGGLSVMSSALRVTGGFTVTGGLGVENAVTVFGSNVFLAGLEVEAEGLRLSGGLTVSANGLTVTDGLMVGSGGVYSKVGVELLSGGLALSNGLTVFNDGIEVTASGLTLFTGGIRVTDGVTLYNAGLKLTGGLTVFSAGVRVTDGVTVKETGLFLTAGMTVGGNGLTVGTHVTVHSGGVITPTQLLLGANGLMVSTSGLTVNNDGLLLKAGGLTITQQGLSLAGSLTVYSGGVLVVTAAVTVADSGMEVKGGVFTTGLHFSSSTSLYTNEFLTGVQLNGAEPLLVHDVGMHINGDLESNGPVRLQTAYTTSDQRLKTNVSQITGAGALKVVRAVRGVSFLWLDQDWDLQRDGVQGGQGWWEAAGTPLPSDTYTSYDIYAGNLTSASGTPYADEWGGQGGQERGQGRGVGEGQGQGRRRNVGFLAQQVRDAIPEAVASRAVAGLSLLLGQGGQGGQGLGGEDKGSQEGVREVLGVRYDDLVAVLVEAIKELDMRTQAQAQMQKQAQEEPGQMGAKVGEGEGEAKAQVAALLVRLQALEAEETLLTAQLDSLSLSLSPRIA